MTGVLIMLGKATIYVESGKQKIVTRSSTSICDDASEIPTNSASVDDLVTIFCFPDLTYIVALPSIITTPVTDFPSSYRPNDES